MKKLAISIMFGGILLALIYGLLPFYFDYLYSREYGSYWSLAQKASSIDKKIEGIDKFVKALDESDMRGKYNAIYWETPNNSFDQNLDALKSLQIRLHEIKAMDVKSFEYQTAMQQITQQEQNEAGEMLSVFRGIWFKENCILLWGWIWGLQMLFFVACPLFSLAIFASIDYNQLHYGVE